MGFSASYIEITLRYELLGQKCQTARVYAWDGVAIASADADEVGEAWWNHYKGAWRGLVPDATDVARFTTVLVREVGGSLSYGEYAIPVEEQGGTRTGNTTTLMPSYCAVGVRLTVGSRLTRPGQFRAPFLLEQDVTNNTVAPAFLELVDDLAELYSNFNTLGAPTATGVLKPSVVTYGEDANEVTAGQEIIGRIINGTITSQVSRRAGNGS